jgi:adenylate cyclase
MPVKALNSRAVGVPAQGEGVVLQWLLTETRHETTLDRLMTAFCLRLRAAGFPIARSVLQLHTHHPQWLGTRIVWRRDDSAAVAEPIKYGVMQSRMYLDSPVAALHNGAKMVHVHLEGAPPANEYPMFASLRREGFTDYVGWPLLFTLDRMHTITFASDRRGGFTAAELECVAGLLPAFALTIEVRFKNELSRRLLDTYVGPHAGEQILSGMTTRGSGRTIEAAVAMFDLRGFTALSDTYSRDDVIALLNDYFDAVAEPIDHHGGEILKFMGDGLLAVFPLDRVAACENALSAVSGACTAMRALNDLRRAAGKEALGFGVGVNIGEVMYGNIGTSARLDFTVIGPAVNAAARLEALTKDVGVCALFSEAFAEKVHPKSLVPKGRHCLRGFGKPIEVFTFANPQ